MNPKAVKILVLSSALIGSIGGGALLYLSRVAIEELPPTPEWVVKRRLAMEHPAAPGGHGEEKPAEGGHGGGHGEAAKPAEGHGGGHGEAAKPAEGGHGGGHGEPAKAEGGHGGGHGAPEGGAAAAKSSEPLSLVSLDEIFVNVVGGKEAKALAIKLEIELFDEKLRPVFEQHQPAVKHTIIQASREQDFVRLNSISGKLYFKEFLVSRINEYFHEPVIRDIHFSSFFLQ